MCQEAVSLLQVRAFELGPRLTPVPARILSTKQRLLCGPVVRGYCLAFKTWGKISMRKNSSLSADTGIAPQRNSTSKTLARYAGVIMLFPGWSFLIVTRTLFEPSFNSNCPAITSLTISFTAKVGPPIILTTRFPITNSQSVGLGFIMLLSGEPGVGKTLTAESGALIWPYICLDRVILKLLSRRGDAAAIVLHECKWIRRDSY